MIVADFAVVTTTATASTTSYLHRDHLGSVDAVTDAAGAVVQRMSFDAWGKRREVNWLAMTDAAVALFDTTLTTRGFTGHEMVDPVGLVHMNGRVYDPEIGRFLSADPHVQDTTNLQAWNRYTYVNNNPLSFTDPSGFFLSGLFKGIGHAFSGIFRAIGSAFKALLKSSILRSIIQIVACATMPGLGCAAAAGLLTLASGGAAFDAMKAFVFSFAQMGAFSAISDAMATLQSTLGAIGTAIKATVHGIIGGALSIAQGGSYLQGFAGSSIGAIGGAIAGESGLVGQYRDGNAANMLARALISGAAGCAGAIATGGKCAQAAVTAAFASLYNGDAHDKKLQSLVDVLNGSGYDVITEVNMKDANGNVFRADAMYKFNPEKELNPSECAPEARESLRKNIGDFGVLEVKTDEYPDLSKGQKSGYSDFNAAKATSYTSALTPTLGSRF